MDLRTYLIMAKTTAAMEIHCLSAYVHFWPFLILDACPESRAFITNIALKFCSNCFVLEVSVILMESNQFYFHAIICQLNAKAHHRW